MSRKMKISERAAAAKAASIRLGAVKTEVKNAALERDRQGAAGARGQDHRGQPAGPGGGPDERSGRPAAQAAQVRRRQARRRLCRHPQPDQAARPGRQDALRHRAGRGPGALPRQLPDRRDRRGLRVPPGRPGADLDPVPQERQRRPAQRRQRSRPHQPHPRRHHRPGRPTPPACPPAGSTCSKPARTSPTCSPSTSRST